MSRVLLICYRAKEGAQKLSSDQVSSWLSMVPGGDQIIPQLQKLREVADKQGAEAEQLVKETIQEVREVLEKKTSKAAELYDDAAKETKG